MWIYFWCQAKALATISTIVCMPVTPAIFVFGEGSLCMSVHPSMSTIFPLTSNIYCPTKYFPLQQLSVNDMKIVEGTEPIQPTLKLYCRNGLGCDIIVVVGL